MSQTTLHIIAYDIPDDKRRARIHKLLCGFGKWTQYSLFECFLSARELVQMRERLHRAINVEQDSIRIYTVCAACVKQAETIGSEPPQEPVAYLV